MKTQQHAFVAKEYGGRARDYVTSAVHSTGGDLDQVEEVVRGLRTARVLDLGCGGGERRPGRRTANRNQAPKPIQTRMPAPCAAVRTIAKKKTNNPTIDPSKSGRLAAQSRAESPDDAAKRRRRNRRGDSRRKYTKRGHQSQVKKKNI